MKLPVAPWFGNMISAAIGIAFATDCAMKIGFSAAFGFSLVIVVLRIAHNWQDA